MFCSSSCVVHHRLSSFAPFASSRVASSRVASRRVASRRLASTHLSASPPRASRDAVVARLCSVKKRTGGGGERDDRASLSDARRAKRGIR
jgi:hypothetical protein